MQVKKQQLNQSTVSCSFLIVASWPAYRFHRSQIRCLLVHPKGDPFWLFIERTDAEAETPVLWPPHAKSWHIGKNPNAVRDWGQEEKGMTEDEMAGWHHWLDAHELGWTPGIGDGQGCLACCDSWGRKESDTTERLNWTDVFANQLAQR